MQARGRCFGSDIQARQLDDCFSRLPTPSMQIKMIVVEVEELATDLKYNLAYTSILKQSLIDDENGSIIVNPPFD